MNRKIFYTRGIIDSLDIRILVKIISIIKSKEERYTKEDLDYIQVFEIKDDKLINRQEVPMKKDVYDLGFKAKENIKVWAMLGGVSDSLEEYWTVMYPHEY